MSTSEHDVEPIPGLPEDLPDGEKILWQGRPSWRAMARQTFKIRWLAAYFGVFVAARVFVAISQGEGLAGLYGVGFTVGLSALCLGLTAVMAWLQARASVYTITNRRVVMRIGASVPVSWNLPFQRIASADLATRRSGDGDIVLTLAAPNRISWLFLWPHVQPGHILRARPALRAIESPERVAAILEEAVTEWAKDKAAPVVVAATEREGEERRTGQGRPSTAVDLTLGGRLATGTGR